MSATIPGTFGPVNTCCGVTASVGHGLYCEENPKRNDPTPDRIAKVRAICTETLTDYVDDGEPVLAQLILDTLDGK